MWWARHSRSLSGVRPPWIGADGSPNIPTTSPASQPPGNISPVRSRVSTIYLHTMDAELGVLTLTGAKSVEFENGILRVREAQAGVYRHFNLVNGGVRQVEIVPVQV